MNIDVHKFGGASLKDAPSLKNVSNIIQQQSRPAIIVVSAMGKTTNALENLVKSAFFKQDNPQTHLSQVIQYHSDIIQNAFENYSLAQEVEKNIQKYWKYIEQLISQPITMPYGQFYDQIVSVGELVSSIIVSEYLNTAGIYNIWIDVRKIIKTDNQWRAANVLMNESEKQFKDLLSSIIDENTLIITQGFIGSTANDYTTTLGREGSDYTAALMAYFANAQQLTIWKDVEGVLNADPRYFKNTQKLDEISYYDAIEMTYYGATVIHPKTIKPIQNKNIPLYVKSFLNPQNKGTIIHQPKEYKKITTYSFLPNQMLISLQSQDYSFFTESHIQQTFQIINDFNIKINLMQNTALNFSICITYDEVTTPMFIKELQKYFKVLFNENVSILNIRNYIPEMIPYFIQDKEILLEQRTRHHIQLVIRDKNN